MEQTPRRMPPLEPLIARLRAGLPEIQGVWLFGSHAAGTSHAESDLDLAVLGPTAFDPVELFDVGLELGVLAGGDVDLVDLRRAPVVLRKEVLTTGRLVDAHDPAACGRFESDSMALYVAFRDELAVATAGGVRRP